MARGNGARGKPLGVLSLDAIDTRQPGEIRLSGAVNALDQDPAMPLVGQEDPADQARGPFSGCQRPPGTLDMDKVRRQFQQQLEPALLGITWMNQGDGKTTCPKALQRTAKMDKVLRLRRAEPQHDLSWLQSAKQNIERIKNYLQIAVGLFFMKAIITAFSPGVKTI